MTTVEEPVALDMSLDEVIARGRSAPITASNVPGVFRPRGQNKVRKPNKALDFSHNRAGTRIRGGWGANNTQPPFPSHFARTPWDFRPVNDGSRRRRQPISGRLLHISGLEFSVLQEDLQELFSAVGPVEKIWIDYDRTDRSLGTGSVIFENPKDAARAQEIYNGRSIDGSVIALELPVAEMETISPAPRRGRGGTFK